MADEILIGCRTRCRKKIFVVITVEEGKYSQLYSKIREWIKHFRELSSKRKSMYMHAFIRRFRRIKHLIHSLDVLFDSNSLMKKVNGLAERSIVLIVDDEFFPIFKGKYRTKLVIREGDKSQKFYRPLILLADNIANIIRIAMERSKDRRRIENLLREFKI